MNPARTNERSSRTRGRTGGPAMGTRAGSGQGSRFGSSAEPFRRSEPFGRLRPRPAAIQGEFAPPKTITPALPAVEASLSRITGAQAPSGIPVTITAPVAERPKRNTASRGRRRPISAARRASRRQTAFDAAA